MTTIFRVEGKMSTFGGPKDAGMQPDEGLALFNSEQDMINHGLGDFLLDPEHSPFPGLGPPLNPDKALSCLPLVGCRDSQENCQGLLGLGPELRYRKEIEGSSCGLWSGERDQPGGGPLSYVG